MGFKKGYLDYYKRFQRKPFLLQFLIIIGQAGKYYFNVELILRITLYQFNKEGII